MVWLMGSMQVTASCSGVLFSNRVKEMNAAGTERSLRKTCSRALQTVNMTT